MTYKNIVRCLEGKGRRVLVEMAKTARDALPDGADVIIAGGKLFGPIFPKAQVFHHSRYRRAVVEVSRPRPQLRRRSPSSAHGVAAQEEHVNAPFARRPRPVVDEMRRKFGIV